MAKKKRRSSKKKKQNMTNVIIGLFVLVLSALALSHWGLLGNQVANAYRLLFGNTYLFGALLTTLFGLVMVIYNKPPHFSLKRLGGLLLGYVAVMGIFAANFFGAIMVHANFVSVFWVTMQDEFARGLNTVSVGGGIFGTLMYSLFYPLLGQVGFLVLATVLTLVGVTLFFDWSFKTIVSKFQNFGQFFFDKSSQAAKQSQKKYTQFVNTKKTEAKLKRQKRRDMKLPDTHDFDETNVTSVADSPSASESLDIRSSSQVAKPISEAAPVKTAVEQSPKSTAKADDIPFQPVHAGNQEHYQLPPLSLLHPIKQVDQSADQVKIQSNAKKLEQTFKSFGVDVAVQKAILGPTVTKYEIKPAIGVKVSKIVNLSDDLALALAAKDIRIEAPIPGKPLIGIEVPNQHTSTVSFKDVVENQPAAAKAHPLQVPLGKDVSGRIISADLTKMPHLLIAGSTGSGKSVAINTIITSILMKARPEEVKLVLVDPKMVELSVYNGIPHLLIPVVTDAKLAAKALNKAVKEMERRYELFAASGVRNMGEYNQKVEQNNRDKQNPAMEYLPYIVVIVDELSDLMMVAGNEVEAAIVRLAQMARAAGIHMILATQRPSVDVITGLIKANVPSRIAFAVSSGIDSRTILDSQGAEKLIGRGDMLFLPIDANKPERVQGAYIAVDEVENVVKFVSEQQSADYDEEMIPTPEDETDSPKDEPEDEFYDDAVDLVRRQQAASVSMLQRRFRIGYNRAARIVDDMEARGVVGPPEGSKPRKVLLPPPDEGETNEQN